MSGDVFGCHKGEVQQAPYNTQNSSPQQTTARLRMPIVPGLRCPAQGNGPKTYT